ncbi:hypothetical protein lerEdw1_008840 [Lerista edwardsae]|nr:hypothetical protein lerEdw1_008840 [Lerista edwardsae]
MEPHGSVHCAPAHAPKDGPCKSSVPQKNAYARLVQKHHSGRFRSYLNHIAQKLQLEESALNDSGSDTEPSLKRGLVREALSKNGMKMPGSRALQPGPLDLVGPEKPGEDQEEGCVQRWRQQQRRHQRDLSTSKGDESHVAEEEEEEEVSPHWHGDDTADLLSASPVLCGQRLSPRPASSQQKTSVSGEREKEELWRNKHGTWALLDRADDCGQGGLDVSTASARKACHGLLSQTHGELLRVSSG